MNILATMTAQREKLDAKVNAAISRSGTHFIASIADAAGQIACEDGDGKP